MKERNFIIAYFVAQILIALVSLALFCTGLYVAWHFISKLW